MTIVVGEMHFICPHKWGNNSTEHSSDNTEYCSMYVMLLCDPGAPNRGGGWGGLNPPLNFGCGG